MRHRANLSRLHLLSPIGFKAAAARAGIKSSGEFDVGLLLCEVPASAAGVFTTNKVFAAPIKIGRQNVAAGALRGIVVNSGNANACTGRRGEQDARTMCALTARAVGCDARQILPSSTGIIGHMLPMGKIAKGISLAANDLGNSPRHARDFADAILTTDTRRKTAAVRFRIGNRTITLAGICKGSGMIGPRMALHATMLAYLTTDAKIPPRILRPILSAATDASFNAVTIDDHTSTNDTAAILASGLAAPIDSFARVKSFAAAMKDVCQSLAYQIAADGEGATKVVQIDIRGAKTESDAKLIARAIANSPLVKCAMNGNDPNWGRIVSAAGLCGAAFNPDKATLNLQGVPVFKSGRPALFNADALSKALDVPNVLVDLVCGLGKSSATVWTCDLSKTYVTINADYHT
jgi:glutamate N-acetyltransferase / amino-acid N-acetyltransferase